MTPTGPRILAAGLGGAAIYAGILGGAAAAQEPIPAPTATPSATPAPSPAPTSPGPSSAAGTGAVPTAAASPPPVTTAPNTAAAVGGPQTASRPAAAAPRGGNLAAGEGRIAPAAQRPPATHRDQRATARQHVAAAPVSIDPLAGLVIPAASGAPVPDALIAGFRIPPFLLPIYQAAGVQYGIRWEVLAAINEIETDYGRNVHVSSAGARGWMQFMPATWRTYGVDANRDGRADPANPVDAIFSAARYLKAAGAETDLRGALLAYNHAGWYADSVLRRAQAIGTLPSELVASLTGLAEGRFPVIGPSADGGHTRRGMAIEARPGARVVAVDDGRVIRRGQNPRLGRFVVLRDVYGNTFTYGDLGAVRRVYHRRLIKRGTRVLSGTVLGRVGGRPSVTFTIRPAGRGAPQIDPRPILEGWRLLESADRYGATRERRRAGDPSVGQILLMSRPALTRVVLADRRISIYPCGREDIRAGRIDRRVLATMLFLAASGLRPTISSLECGHGYLTTSGNVSEHSAGMAMDIAAVNGIRITPAMQGPGSITDVTIRRLLTLQGAMRPHQIISLMSFSGATNTLAMGDHADHIHVGWHMLGGAAARVDATLRPDQWVKLSDRLVKITNPRVAPARHRRAERD